MTDGLMGMRPLRSRRKRSARREEEEGLKVAVGDVVRYVARGLAFQGQKLTIREILLLILGIYFIFL